MRKPIPGPPGARPFEDGSFRTRSGKVFDPDTGKYRNPIGKLRAAQTHGRTKGLAEALMEKKRRGL